MENYYIIIRGPLGVGKTSIAKRLAEQLTGEYISIDDILLEHGLADAPYGQGIPLENFIKANEVVIPKIEKSLSKGVPVIIDGNFYYKEQIQHFQKYLTINAYVFTINASLETCIDRDSHRKNTAGIDTVKGLYRLVNRFEVGMLIETEERTLDEEVEEILAYLPSFSHEGQKVHHS